MAEKNFNTQTMQAITVHKIGSFEIGRLTVPEPGRDEALLRVTVTGLCRTDLKIIRVGHRDLVLPRIPGEEVVGEVIDVGPETDSGLLGKRVYVYPGKWCGICPACMAGAENLCHSMQIMGFHRDGGFAGYVVAPLQSLIQLPDSLSDEQAVFAEPLSCCLNALELARLAPFETIAVWGGGPAGQLLSRASVTMGALPTVIEPDIKRRELANGISEPPDQLFNVCVVAVGDKTSYQQALSRLAPRGRLVVFSGLAKDFSVVDTDFNQLHYMEQTIVGAYGCCFRHGRQAISLLESGRLPVFDLVSHRMPLSMLQEALDMVADRRCMKIHLYPEA